MPNRKIVHCNCNITSAADQLALLPNSVHYYPVDAVELARAVNVVVLEAALEYLAVGQF